MYSAKIFYFNEMYSATFLKQKNEIFLRQKLEPWFFMKWSSVDFRQAYILVPIFANFYHPKKSYDFFSLKIWKIRNSETVGSIKNFY